MSSYDLLVVGGGAAGMTAALRGRELGAKVALVERGGKLGGTCLNDGCVPTRVLARAARLVREFGNGALFGIHAAQPQVDLIELLGHTEEVNRTIHAYQRLREELDLAGVVTCYGHPARFTGSHKVVAGPLTLETERVVLAAGGGPRRLHFPGAELALDSRSIWGLRESPRRICIIGSGSTGCQFATAFNAFGADVTLLEMAPAIYPTADSSISAALTEQLRLRGIACRTSIGGVERIDRGGDGLTVVLADGSAMAVDVVLLSVGWPPNSSGMGLEEAGVQTNQQGFVVVDEFLRTSAPHIYGVGDITGGIMLAQVAHHAGRAAAENALSAEPQPFTPGVVPSGVHTDPEIGGVGLTELAARKQYQQIVVATVPFRELERALIDHLDQGFLKLIVDGVNRQVVGAHVLGEQAAEIVQVVAVAMAAKMPVDELARIRFAYPTFTEIVGLAARRAAEQLGHYKELPRKYGER